MSSKKMRKKRHDATMREYERMVATGMNPELASSRARTSVVYNCGTFSQMQEWSPGAQVGIFWVEPDTDEVYAVTVSVSGEEYEFLGEKSYSGRGVIHYNSSVPHEVAWNSVKERNPDWKSFSLEDVPRGRVILKSGPGARRAFDIWIPKKLDTPECRHSVLKSFSINPSMACFVVSDLTSPHPEEGLASFYPDPFGDSNTSETTEAPSDLDEKSDGTHEKIEAVPWSDKRRVLACQAR